MTKKEMIDVIVTGLMLEKSSKEKQDAIETMLRKGWKGFENFTDLELKKITDDYDKERLGFLLMAAELIRDNNASLNQK